MIADRLCDLILGIAVLPPENWRDAYTRLSHADRGDLLQFVRDHHPDDHTGQLVATLAELPSNIGEALDRLSDEDRDRYWAFLIRAIHPPGHQTAEELFGSGP